MSANAPYAPMRTLALLLAALSFGLLVACGGDDESGSGGGKSGSDATPLTERAEAQLAEAGSNVQAVYETLTSIRGQLKDDPKIERGQLEAVSFEAQAELESSLKALVRSIGNGDDKKKMAKIAGWMKETADAEAAVDGDNAEKLFRSQLKRMNEYRLVVDPNNEALRSSLGWEKFSVDLDAIMEEPFLDTEDTSDLKKAKKWIKDYAETAGFTQWLKPGWKKEKDLAALLKRLEKKREAFEKRMEDPFEQRAQEMAKEIGDFLRQDLENDTYEFAARTHYPYLMIVEKNRRWNETDVARRRGEALQQLHDIYYDKYATNIDLKKITEPVPVIYFYNFSGYQKYTQKRGMSGALGHFEPGSGRLFTSKGTDIGTVFHEGTHQLSFFSSGATKGFLNRSYWFEEGLAEYLAANRIKKNKDTGKWDYDIGLLQVGRLDYWRQNVARAYSLWDLLELTYASREVNTRNNEQDKNLMVYSQGWFLCYFMNNFKIDSDGMVVLGEEGIYTKEWIKFFESNLGGNSSRAKFLECLGVTGKDDPKWKKFEKEFDAYFNWVNSKLLMKHSKDKELVPWQDAISRRGKKFGEREDDLLFPAR